MEIQDYANQQMKFYETIMNYFACQEESDTELQILADIFQNQNIIKEKGTFREFLSLISKLSDNYHRSHHFFNKIEKILSHYLPQIKENFIDVELIQIFENNELILLFLLEQKIIKNPEESILSLINLKNSDRRKNYKFYFYPEIKSKLTPDDTQLIESKLVDYSKDEMSLFYKNRKIGENDSTICTIIRNDSIESFVSYVTQTNYPLSGKIPTSLFETNDFLIQKEPLLIEYASFYGSIQIIQYLLINDVKLTPLTWLYAIHSNNAEVIRNILEENKIRPPEDDFVRCVKESIKCHHNDIATYLIEYYFNDKEKLYDIGEDIFDNLYYCIFGCYNYSFVIENLKKQFAFYYLCEFGYYELVKLFLKDKEIDINAVFILKSIFFLIRIQRKFFFIEIFMKFDVFHFNQIQTKFSNKILYLYI